MKGARVDTKLRSAPSGSGLPLGSGGGETANNFSHSYQPNAFHLQNVSRL